VQIPRKFYDAIIAQAFAELPNECVGLLAAKLEPTGDLIRVERRYPLVNALASPVEYLSDDDSMLAAHSDMRKHGLDIVAVYHSHPTTEPVPSRKDRERNYSPEVVNFIISLKGPEPVMRGWWLTDTDYREAEWECVDDG
jgi:proteasome lid subunit RPN8/RPN11